MGHPKRIINKFKKPNHPWNKDRIDSERELSKKYGLTNKKQLWKMGSLLKSYKDRTKKSFTSTGEQSDIERKQLIDHLKRYGLITKDSLDEVLGLPIEAVMERRLQSIVFKRKLARSIKHARQLITHEHITINGKKVTSPSYMVTLAEEATVAYAPDSALMSEDHPERYIEKELKEAAEAKEKAAKKKDADKVVVEPEPVPEEPPIDPLEATKTEDLDAVAITKKEEKKDVKEKIEEDIKKKEQVAEGKPAVDDEEKEEQDTNEAEELADDEEKKGAVVKND